MICVGVNLSHANDDPVVEDNPCNTPRPDTATKVKERRGDDRICPQHGPMCIPGICKARERVDRDKRWQKERKEREENKRKRTERNAGEGNEPYEG